VEAVARGKRISLLYGTVAINESNEILDIPHHLLGEGTDGIIVVGAFQDEAVMALAGNMSRPVVLVDGPGISTRFDAVSSDNVNGTKTITNHLVEMGHTNIALLTRLAEANPNFTAREAGYRQAMADHGFEPVVGRIEKWKVSDAIDQIFEQCPKVTAIVCVNDQFGLDAGNELEQRGITVPGDISLVGFDNTDHSTALRAGLTTMNVDKIGMGRLAATLLDYRLQWPDSAPASVILTPSLTIRGSVASPNVNRHQISTPSGTESFR
jgi:LacI family transcriptional regulator